jgi:hypothetical protein
MTDQDDRIAQLEARIAELEGGGGSGSASGASARRWMNAPSRSGMEEAFWAVMHGVFPEEARKHLRTAGREQLLAARVYLDRWIGGLEDREADPADTRPHEKIDIE